MTQVYDELEFARTRIIEMDLSYSVTHKLLQIILDIENKLSEAERMLEYYKEGKRYELVLTDEEKEKIDKIIEIAYGTDFTRLKEDVKSDESIDEDMKEDEFPADEESYYFISAHGKIEHIKFEYDDFDRGTFKIGNHFKTKEEAEFEVERLKVIAEMKEFAEPDDTLWDGNIPHCHLSYVCFGHKIGRIEVCSNYEYKANHIYFSSIKIAEKCIDTVSEDRLKKYYFKIED